MVSVFFYFLFFVTNPKPSSYKQLLPQVNIIELSTRLFFLLLFSKRLLIFLVLYTHVINFFQLFCWVWLLHETFTWSRYIIWGWPHFWDWKLACQLPMLQRSFSSWIHSRKWYTAIEKRSKIRIIFLQKKREKQAWRLKRMLQTSLPG